MNVMGIAAGDDNDTSTIKVNGDCQATNYLMLKWTEKVNSFHSNMRTKHEDPIYDVDVDVDVDVIQRKDGRLSRHVHWDID
jgi:hypothetical protein